MTTISGQRFRRTHQQTIDSILGPGVRSVRSEGNSFYNRDSWTLRAFTAAFCRWAQMNPGLNPDERDVRSWLREANHTHIRPWERGIVIAQTPDDLDKKRASALMGGGYHEAWHTEWSRLAPLAEEDVWPRLGELWRELPQGKRLPSWSSLTRTLLEWSNIIEDIRIERLGCRKYPGSKKRMEDLQDLILDMEREGRALAEHRGLPTHGPLQVVMGAFRDLGLGYETPTQALALRGYRKRNLKAYRMVHEGPLRPLLDRAIALRPEDDCENLWLAMEVVIELIRARYLLLEAPPKKEAPPSPQAPPPLGGGKEPVRVGQKALIKQGPYAGRRAEVVRVGLPDPETGIQELEYRLLD
jgi:hypothetical protein